MVIFVVVIIKLVGSDLGEPNKANTKNRGNNNSNAGTYQVPKQAAYIESARTQVQQQTQQAVQEQIARTKQRILESRGMHSSGSENQRAMQQVNASRMEARNTTILQRAKANAEEDKVDVTLETMEAEHNHSERVSAAVHHHPEDVIPESMLGSVEDLMIKGFDGNLCFERDFLGEGLDMISRFSYQ